jgi:hypothetical protein
MLPRATMLGEGGGTSMTPEPLDFRERRFEDADFTRARLHAPSFEEAKITDGWFYNADILGDIEGLRVNGVEVAPLVEAERDRLFPERVKLRATDPEGLREAWGLIEGLWQRTVARARALPESRLNERVDDEWSFIETLRHLIYATDCWLVRAVREQPNSHHPWGLAGSFLADPESCGLDYAAHPSLDEVLEVRGEKMRLVRETIAVVTAEDLERLCTPPDSPGHPTAPHKELHCLHVILNEEWEHNRYANRDLEILESQ